VADPSHMASDSNSDETAQVSGCTVLMMIGNCFEWTSLLPSVEMVNGPVFILSTSNLWAVLASSFNTAVALFRPLWIPGISNRIGNHFWVGLGICHYLMIIILLNFLVHILKGSEQSTTSWHDFNKKFIISRWFCQVTTIFFLIIALKP